MIITVIIGVKGVATQPREWGRNTGKYGVEKHVNV
jgi:hypothetical protein